MRAEIQGFSPSDTFYFQVYEHDDYDDDFVVTIQGRQITDGGKIYAAAEWTSVWQDDGWLGGNPEFYFKVYHSSNNRWARDDVTVTRAPVQLQVPYYDQAESLWCWATSASMLLEYYGYDAKPWMVAADFDAPYDVKAGQPGAIGLEWYLEEEYDFGQSNAWVYLADLLSANNDSIRETICDSLSYGHPVWLGAIERDHAVIVTGYDSSGPIIHDPDVPVGGVYRHYSWSEFFDWLDSSWLTPDATLLRANPDVVAAPQSGTISSIQMKPQLVFGRSDGSNLYLAWDGTESAGYRYIPVPSGADYPEGMWGYAATQGDTLEIVPYYAQTTFPERSLDLRVRYNILDAYTGIAVEAVLTEEWSESTTGFSEVPSSCILSVPMSTFSDGVYLVKVELQGKDSAVSSFSVLDDYSFYFELSAADYQAASPLHAGFGPAAVHSGESFSAFVDVENTADVPGGAFTTKFYASENTVITGLDYFLGEDSSSGIGSGGIEQMGFVGRPLPSNIPFGTYYVGWVIEANDKNQGNNSGYIPGQLLTVLEADIDVELPGQSDNVHSYSFGIIETGDSVSREFTVRNEGNDAVVVSSLTGLDSPFSFLMPNTTIQPGETRTLTITFSPHSEGAKNDTLIIHSNDPDESTYEIALTGTGVVPEDQFEYDDSPNQATSITVDGAGQEHTIHSGSDVDWVKFTLSETSGVAIQTDGLSGDTRMWLYGPDNWSDEIAFDDNYNDVDPGNTFSRILRYGVKALEPGTYYVKIDENGNNHTIGVYTVTVATVDYVEDVIISEFMASNKHLFIDEDWESSDWIELYNQGVETVDLQGWWLSDDDDDLTKWEFPESFEIVPGEYKIIFCSNGREGVNDPGKNPDFDGIYYHTSFKLSADGEDVALSYPNGTSIAGFANYPQQFEDISYGLAYPSLDEHCFLEPTPGAANTSDPWLLVENTSFNYDGGFYDAPFDLTISTDTFGATIYYTTDGSKPSETNGTLYDSPITISTTTVVRAKAYKEYYASSIVDTHTYIFLSDVFNQPNDPAGFPDAWGGGGTDYEMDQDVVQNPLYQDQLLVAMQSIPTMSIVMDTDDIFGANGIYTNSGSQGIGWERPTSVEWINTDGSTGFQIDAGIRIYGGPFRNMHFTRKKSFRLLFKDEYGPTKLNFDMFQTEGAATSFDTIILRAGANDGWNNWGKANTQYIVDEYMRRTQLALSEPASHGTFVHLYINGLYWGLYNPVERPEASFAAEYFGGEKEEWDALNSGSATGDSNTASWKELLGVVRDDANMDMSDPENPFFSNDAYQMIQGNNPDGTPNRGNANPDDDYRDMLDVDNYIAYMFSNFWGGTGDWGYQNWYNAAQRPPNDTGFKFFNWDSEGAIVVWSNVFANRTGVNIGAAEPYGVLRYNPEFQMLFADYTHKWLFNDGPATYQQSYHRYEELANTIELAIIAESARWGDQAGASPYTQAHWEVTKDYVLGAYMPQRPVEVLQQLKNAGLYPSTAAPSFKVGGVYQHGGTMNLGDSLTIEASAGVIYVTTDGSDPRSYGGGLPDPGDMYTGALILNENTSVKARVYDSVLGEWSALNEAAYCVDLGSNIRVTEIMYNPAPPTQAEMNAGYSDNNDFEFIEIKNVSATKTLPLGGLSFNNGIDFTFDAMSVSPGQYVIVAKNPAAFSYRYSEFTGTVVGPFEHNMSLNNSGEQMELDSLIGGIVHKFNYGDGWYDHTDGGGFSLTIRDPLGGSELWGQKLGWRASAGPGGTPGYDDVLTDPGSVVINEVLAHSDTPFVDTIELHNTSDSAVDISGWFLSDSSNDLTSYQIPTMDPIPSGGYAVFYADTHFGGDFMLSEHGDDVYLSSNAGDLAGGYREHVEFEASPNNVSVGLYAKSTGDTDFVQLDAPTFGLANASPYSQDMAITEIMYNPVLPGVNEYILMQNISESEVSLYDPANPANTWRITGGSNFTFPEGVNVQPGQFVLISNVDSATYLATHTVGANVEVFGPFSGSLGNGGDTITVTRPGVPETSPAFVPYITVETIKYNAASPWPEAADGDGPALSKLTVSLGEYSNDPINWGVSGAPVVTVDPLRTDDDTPQLTGTVTDIHQPTTVNVTVAGNDYIVPVVGDTWTLVDDTITPLGEGVYDVMVSAFDTAGNLGVDSSVGELEIYIPHVVGQHIFYNNSSFDGNNTLANTDDDNAIDNSKEALLLPGGTVDPVNYSSYARGINGIMVDIADMDAEYTPSVNDFGIRVYDAGAGQWIDGPDGLSVSVREVGGVSRITLTWPDFEIVDRWLKVTVKADVGGEGMGLVADDVFYFASAVADIDGTGAVDINDYRAFKNGLGGIGGVDMPGDLNRDGRVDLRDFSIMRGSFGNTVPTPNILIQPSAPAPTPALQATSETIVAVTTPVTHAMVEPITITATPLVPIVSQPVDDNEVNNANGDSITTMASAPAIDLLAESFSLNNYIPVPQPISIGLPATTPYRAATDEHDLRPLREDILSGSTDNMIGDDLQVLTDMEDSLDLLAESAVAIPL